MFLGRRIVVVTRSTVGGVFVVFRSNFATAGTIDEFRLCYMLNEIFSWSNILSKGETANERTATRMRGAQSTCTSKPQLCTRNTHDNSAQPQNNAIRTTALQEMLYQGDAKSVKLHNCIEFCAERENSPRRHEQDNKHGNTVHKAIRACTAHTHT